jgi:hypothetical protein
MKENYIDKMFEEDLPFGNYLHSKQALHHTIVSIGNTMDSNEVRCLLDPRWNENYKFDHMMKYEDTINLHMHIFLTIQSSYKPLYVMKDVKIVTLMLTTIQPSSSCS